MKKWLSSVLILIGTAIVAYGLVFMIGQNVPIAPKEDTAAVVTIPPAIPAPAPVERPLLELVNELRVSKGVAPLTASPELDKSAQEKADDMAAQHYFDHVNPQGIRGRNLIPKYLPSVTYGSENLTTCNVTSGTQGAFNAWLNSPAHYNGMIDPNVTLYGTAVALDEQNNCNVWVNHFAAV